MRGWKTWLAAIAMLLSGANMAVEGDLVSGITAISAAGGMVGLGHKIEKAGRF